MSRAWGAISAESVARLISLPVGVRVVGIGSAVLGGAGKTPLAAALASAFASECPAVVGHAYRAHPAHPRVVRLDDPVREVGDDALSIAKLLPNTPVIVAPTREEAIAYAASLGHRLLFVDGLLQTAPTRLFRSILVLDATAPWGSGACPPAGDLRAPVSALVAAADHVAVLDCTGAPARPASPLPLTGVRVPSSIGGAFTARGDRVPLSSLGAMRCGVLLTVARPHRVLATLTGAGIQPSHVVSLADHALPTSRVMDRAAQVSVDAWLTTARCATKLPAAIGGAPVLALDHRLDVSALVDNLRRSTDDSGASGKGEGTRGGVFSVGSPVLTSRAMKVLRRLFSAAALGALLSAPLAVTGCAGGSSDAKTANVQSGDMPSGATWKGVYFSELYGYLHLVDSGSEVQGKWLRPHKDKWGEVKGEATGDVLHFTWTEHTVGGVGPNSNRSGKGYFKYKRPAGENVDDTIAGEIGKGENEVGEPWDAIKQRNLAPDLASIGGTGATDIGGGDWDGDNKEKGKAEKPAKP